MAKKKATPKKTPAKGRNAKGQFDFGNEGTRKKWESPQAMEKDIDEYFKRCDEHVVTEWVFGKKQRVPKPKPYLIEGLAVALGVDRTTLLNYEKRKGYEPYFIIVKEAKRKVLTDMMERGMSGDSHATLTMFVLKNNYKFTDKQEIEHTGDEIIVRRPKKPSK